MAASAVDVFVEPAIAEAAREDFVTELTPSPDFEKVIETCGGVGEKVEDPEQLIGALERGLQRVADGTPALLNVITQAARG